MGNSPVDRNKDYMYKTWGTTHLISDYWNGSPKEDECNEEAEKHCIQEVYHDTAKKIRDES